MICPELAAADAYSTNDAAITATNFAIAEPCIKPKNFDYDYLVTKTVNVTVSLTVVIVNALVVSTKLRAVLDYSCQKLASYWRISCLEQSWSSLLY